jgi:hypothetical protein
MASDSSEAGAGDAAAKQPYVAPKLTRLGLLRKLTRYTF